MGANTKKALAQYQKRAPAPPAAGSLSPATPSPLRTPPGLSCRRFRPIWRSRPRSRHSITRRSLEALAERFHSTPALLQLLNPGAQFKAGEQIQVPNVEPLIVPVEKPEGPEAIAAAEKERAARPAGTTGAAARRPPKPNTIAIVRRLVTVSKAASALTVEDASGRTIFYAPVTTGSEHDPLPIGEWKVNGVQFNPPFNYNPELFWDADPSHSKAKIPPGPNNPVGLVWIDLSKEHYGIHGTPEP